MSKRIWALDARISKAHTHNAQAYRDNTEMFQNPDQFDTLYFDNADNNTVPLSDDAETNGLYKSNVINYKAKEIPDTDKSYNQYVGTQILVPY